MKLRIILITLMNVLYASSTLSYPIVNKKNIETIVEAQQITNDEFEKADDEYNKLTSELNRIRNEMSKATESGDNELYNKLNEAYKKAAGDRKKVEAVRLDFMKQNKELVGVKKLYNEGNAAFKLGKDKEALDKYNEAIKNGLAANSPALNETVSRAYYQMGIVNKNQKKFQEAINAFDNAIKFDSDYEHAYYARGNTHASINKTNQAIKDLEKAIEINNSYYQAYYNLGTIYLNQYNQLKRTNLLDQAESAFRDAARINPEYYQAHTNLGRVLLEKKRATEAVDALNKSVSIEKNYLSFYYLAKAYNQLNDPNSAIQSGENCLKHRKNFAAAFLEIGDAYKQKGNEETAIQWYEKAKNDRRYRKLAEYKIDMIKNKDKYIK